MLLKRLILIAGLLALVYAGVLINGAITNARYAKEKALARTAYDEMMNHYSDEFAANLLSFKFVQPRVYRIETTGLADSHAAGKFGFNAMAVLAMTEWNIKTGQGSFTIYGYQDGELIFEVYYTPGIQPTVTLHGPWEGIEYIPSFRQRTELPGDYIGARKNAHA